MSYKEAISLENVRQNIVLLDLQMKALIQDIWVCKSSLDDLNDLNYQGRGKLAKLRKDIEHLDQLAKDDKMISEVQSHRLQLSSTLQAFKNANMSSLISIQKSLKEELLSGGSNGTELRQRKKTDKPSLVKKSSGVTDQLLSISRQLAETTQRSAETLDNLVTSSSGVHNTRDELQSTAGTISQSGKLLKKYGRREFTDKIVIFFAFMFFVICVLYILHKRLI